MIIDQRALDLRTRATTSIRFNLKVFWRIFEKYSTRGASLYYFSPKKLVRLFLLMNFYPLSGSKMIELLKFDDLFPATTTL